LIPDLSARKFSLTGSCRGLQTLNFNYDIHDLEMSTPERLLKHKQLWVVTTEFMDGNTQSLLAAYVKQGDI